MSDTTEQEMKYVGVISRVEVGSVVAYADPRGKLHNAIVTAVWGEFRNRDGQDVDYIYVYETNGVKDVQGQAPVINVVYVSDDADANDQYGRQLAQRATSVNHQHNSTAHGNWWK